MGLGRTSAQPLSQSPVGAHVPKIVAGTKTCQSARARVPPFERRKKRKKMP